MAIGRHHGAYRAAERGYADPLPEPLLKRVEDVPDLKEALSTAVRLVFESAKTDANERGHNAPTAWTHLKDKARTEQEHHDLMRVTLYLAKQHTEYWGIENPEKNRYCSTCRLVKPRSEFDGPNSYNCQDCTS